MSAVRRDRSSLWNEVERLERRKDSQLAREIKLAIPVELNRTQQIELVKEFANEQFVSKGMVADVSFHELSSHNPHAHIMLTMREIDEQGFNQKKNRDWNKRELLEKQREAWAVTANLALEKAGVTEAIDHRTLSAQGINRIPQIHLGSAVTAMMKRGISTDKGALYLAIEQANQKIISLERSIATKEQEINTLTPSENKVSTTVKDLPDDTKSYPESERNVELSNAQLISAWQFLQAWRDRQPLESNSEFLTLQENILRLSQLENQLIQDVNAQKQFLSEIQQLISVDPEVLDPEGSISSKPRQKLLKLQSDLVRTQTRLSEAKQALANFQSEHQQALKLESTLSQPNYQSRLQFLRSSYHLFAQCQFILKHLGQTQKDNQSLYFQGKNYRFEHSGTTITISHRERTKPLFVATDHRKTGGIIDIHSFNIHSEDINTITNLVQHLEADLQPQQKQGRGLSL